MYPSDYGYATSGGTTTDRNQCLSKELLNWESDDCTNNNWLRNNNQYTITPSSQSSYLTVIIFMTGRVLFFNSSYQRQVRPVVFLKSTIKIIDGDGSISDPYILAL